MCTDWPSRRQCTLPIVTESGSDATERVPKFTRFSVARKVCACLRARHARVCCLCACACACHLFPLVQGTVHPVLPPTGLCAAVSATLWSTECPQATHCHTQKTLAGACMPPWLPWCYALPWLLSMPWPLACVQSGPLRQSAPTRCWFTLFPRPCLPLRLCACIPHSLTTLLSLALSLSLSLCLSLSLSLSLSAPAGLRCPRLQWLRWLPQSR